ncbi:hypothetical protein C5C90_13130 [Rathayibacter sp. AY1D4]|nr:hypothetical protein C5C90_13130 [Rathayibacter sp. AY1D4]
MVICSDKGAYRCFYRVRQHQPPVFSPPQQHPPPHRRRGGHVPYIRRISVTAPGTRNEHIVAVQHSVRATGPLHSEPVGSIVGRIDSGAVFRSHNDRTGAEAQVITRRSGAGRRYIATTSNGVESDNLLSLPRY